MAECARVRVRVACAYEAVKSSRLLAASAAWAGARVCAGMPRLCCGAYAMRAFVPRSRGRRGARWALAQRSRAGARVSNLKPAQPERGGLAPSHVPTRRAGAALAAAEDGPEPGPGRPGTSLPGGGYNGLGLGSDPVGGGRRDRDRDRDRDRGGLACCMRHFSEVGGASQAPTHLRLHGRPALGASPRPR